jgi:hypothetical protein
VWISADQLQLSVQMGISDGAEGVINGQTMTSRMPFYYLFCCCDSVSNICISVRRIFMFMSLGFLHIVTCRRQLLSNGSANTFPAITDALATIKELCETMFSMRSFPRAYKKTAVAC